MPLIQFNVYLCDYLCMLRKVIRGHSTLANERPRISGAQHQFFQIIIALSRFCAQSQSITG